MQIRNTADLCRGFSRTPVLVMIGAFLLFLLWFIARWFPILWWLAQAVLTLLGLLFAAVILAAVLRKLCWKRRGSPKGTGSIGHPFTPSQRIPAHTYKRPDPLIYAQFDLMARGLAVTWDNPDIQLFDGPTPIPSSDLLPSHLYRVRARIWNGSTEAPAVNLLVQFHILTFGIGVTRETVGQAFVDLPVKGAPGHPAVAEFAWTTPPAPGHYCLQVELLWPDDANPHNNLGQENLNVKKLNSPNATFAFPIRNNSPFARTLRLEADSYALPRRPPCEESHKPRPNDQDQPRDRLNAQRQSAHRRGLFPIPDGWVVDINPPQLDLRPDETQSVTVKITSNGQPVTRQAINVNAFADNEPVGGVTLIVHS